MNPIFQMDNSSHTKGNGPHSIKYSSLKQQHIDPCSKTTGDATVRKIALAHSTTYCKEYFQSAIFSSSLPWNFPISSFVSKD